MVQVATVGTALLLAAACAKPGTGNGTLGDGGDGQGVSGLAISAGTLILSDGTKVVRIGDQSVTFPSTVTDAAVSPDGSRLAYVDGDNNITVALLDGTGQTVLTTSAPGVTRSRPTWQSNSIAFAEKRPDGTSALILAEANGCGYDQTPAVHPVSMDTGDNTSYVDLAPSSADRVGTDVRLAFQHEEPSGPEVWITDHVARGYNTEKISNGTEPALSPDGKRLAYVSANGQIVMRANMYEDKTVQLTFGVAKPTRLTWTPDGSRIAFRTATDVESVAVDVTAGANANPTTVVAPAPGCRRSSGRAGRRSIGSPGPIRSPWPSPCPRRTTRQCRSPICRKAFPGPTRSPSPRRPTPPAGRPGPTGTDRCCSPARTFSTLGRWPRCSASSGRPRRATCGWR